MVSIVTVVVSVIISTSIRYWPQTEAKSAKQTVVNRLLAEQNDQAYHYTYYG